MTTTDVMRDLTDVVRIHSVGQRLLENGESFQ